MSAPMLFIIVPIVTAIILWFLQKKRKLIFTIALVLCSLLGMVALFQKIDSALRIGPFAINFGATISILGRSFVLDNSDRFFLIFIFFSLVFWFTGAYSTHVTSRFVPIGLAVTSLITAGLAVQPFLYSSILIELAVIISLPLLIARRQAIGKGLLRFLIFQSLAMPLILLAGWILSGVQTNFSDIRQLYSAAFFLGLGFAFLLGVFPFHFWIPEFCSENDPFINGFMLSILPVAYILIMLDFIDGLAWLKDAAFLTQILRISGALMIVTGGIWAAMQTDLRRIFGYLVIIESGFILVCVSLRNELGTHLFYYTIFSRWLEIALWAIALKIFQQREFDTDFRSMQGKMAEYPFTSITLIIGFFSCAGFPLLASFPTRILLFEQLSSQPAVLSWLLIGMGAAIFTGYRLLRLFVPKEKFRWSIGESRQQLTFLVLGILVLLLIGFFPSVFLRGTYNSLSAIMTLQ